MVVFFFVDAFFATFGAFVFALVFFFKRDVAGSPVVFLPVFWEATDFAAADFPDADSFVELEVEDASLLVTFSARFVAGTNFPSFFPLAPRLGVTVFFAADVTACVFPVCPSCACVLAVDAFPDFRFDAALVTADFAAVE
ncbi:MAG: hypothetical protein NXI04_12265 [Planctomycetaceae bacterium]|nr:hypothetical protein [Planctomycetaceae bacterium]